MAASRRFVLLPWSLVDGSAVLQEYGFARPVVELLEDLMDDEDDVVVRTDLTLPFGLPAAT